MLGGDQSRLQALHSCHSGRPAQLRQPGGHVSGAQRHCARQRLHPALPAAALRPGGQQRPQHALGVLGQQLQALQMLGGDQSRLQALHSCGSVNATRAGSGAAVLDSIGVDT